MGNNVNEPGPLHRVIPMMPPSGNMPNMKGAKVVTGDIRGPGVMELCSESWTGQRSKCRARSKSHKQSKSHKHSKSHRCSKSRAHSNHEVWKPGVWPSQQGRSQSKGRPEEDRSCQPPSTSSHNCEQTRGSGCTTHPAPSKDELSKFFKLKEEVVKQPQGYIQSCAKLIDRTLTTDHETVKCLMAFGENTLKYVAEVLATIEWGDPALETPRVLSSASGAQVAPDTRIGPDHNTFKRGTTADPLGHPL